jgi:hypothetical protein
MDTVEWNSESKWKVSQRTIRQNVSYLTLSLSSDQYIGNKANILERMTMFLIIYSFQMKIIGLAYLELNYLMESQGLMEIRNNEKRNGEKLKKEYLLKINQNNNVLNWVLKENSSKLETSLRAQSQLIKVVKAPPKIEPTVFFIYFC